MEHGILFLILAYFFQVPAGLFYYFIAHIYHIVCVYNGTERISRFKFSTSF